MSLVVGRSRTTKKMGYPKGCHYLCAYGRPLKSRAVPRNIYGDLLPDVIKSVIGFGRKSGIGISQNVFPPQGFIVD